MFWSKLFIGFKLNSFFPPRIFILFYIILLHLFRLKAIIVLGLRDLLLFHVWRFFCNSCSLFFMLCMNSIFEHIAANFGWLLMNVLRKNRKNLWSLIFSSKDQSLNSLIKAQIIKLMKNLPTILRNIRTNPNWLRFPTYFCG